MREICPISQQYGKLLFGNGKSERVEPLSARVSAVVSVFPLTFSTRHFIARGIGCARGEMMMMWCRRGEKTVETFPKSEDDEISSGSSFVCCCLGCRRRLMRGARAERTHRPNYCEHPKPLRFSSFSNQSINLFFAGAARSLSPCRSCDAPAAAHYLITATALCVWREREIFLFYVNRVFMGY